MSFGIEVLHKNGSTALKPEMPAYRFLSKVTANKEIVGSAVYSEYPPLVFVRVASPVKVQTTPVEVNHVSGNNWTFSVRADLTYQVTPSDFRWPDGIPQTIIIEAYVFGVSPATPTGSGFGLEMYTEGGVKGFSLDDSKPLIIDRRVYIDDNILGYRKTEPYPPHHGNIVGLDSSKRWAVSPAWDGMIGRRSGLREFFGLTRVLNVPTGPTGSVFTFIYPGVYISPLGSFVTTISGQWVHPKRMTYTESKDYLPLLLIDTDRYDK